MSPRTPSRPSWPFWLLLAAWFCANCPPRAAYVVVSWLEEAREFSHQRQLTRDVAHLLGGEKLPDRFDVPDTPTPKPPEPALPLNEEMKKLSLALEVARAAAHPEKANPNWRPVAVRMRDQLTAAPPHGPPRDGTKGPTAS